jgi:recombination endonuclease VII
MASCQLSSTLGSMARARVWHVEAGQRFGRGVVLEEVLHDYQRRDGKWVKFRALRMRCDCGTLYEPQLYKVTTGKTRSCGCLRREEAATRARVRNVLVAESAVVRQTDSDAGRRRYLWQYYRMTLEDYEAKLSAQGGVCGVCKKPPQEGHLLHVDHDHACCPITKRRTWSDRRVCGQCNRGLLCFTCNGFVGNYEALGGLAEAYLLQWGEVMASNGSNTDYNGVLEL